MSGDIPIVLSHDEALVLFDWLSRCDRNGGLAGFDDDAEPAVLANMLCSLESELTEPFDPEWNVLLQRARDKVSQPEDGN